MDRKDNRINQILAHLSSAASAAASGISDAAQTASHVVGAKYDAVKLNVELARLHSDQEKLFADVGRTMFMVKSGEVDSAKAVEGEGDTFDAQDTIDKLLLAADQKQQEIDLATERLSKLNGDKVCPVCGKVANTKDVYCAACGAKLPTDS